MRRSDIRRRIVALVMAGVMTLGNVPSAAFAEEVMTEQSAEVNVSAEEAEAQAAAEAEAQAAAEAAAQAAAEEEARIAAEQAAAEAAAQAAAEAEAQAAAEAAAQAEAEAQAAVEEAARIAAEQAAAEAAAQAEAEAQAAAEAAAQAEAEAQAAAEAEAQAAAEEAARIAAEQAAAEATAQAEAEAAAQAAAEAEAAAAEQAAAQAALEAAQAEEAREAAEAAAQEAAAQEAREAAEAALAEQEAAELAAAEAARAAAAAAETGAADKAAEDEKAAAEKDLAIDEEEVEEDEAAAALRDADLYSTQLAQFVKTVTLTITHHEDGSQETRTFGPGENINPFNVEVDDIVELTIIFEEKPNELQFKMDEPLTYDLPNVGIDYTKITPSEDVVDVDIEDSHLNHYITKAFISYTEGHLFSLQFDQNDPYYDKACEGSQVNFLTQFRGTVTSGSDAINHDGIGKFYIDTTGAVSVTKHFNPDFDLTQAEMEATTFSMPLTVAKKVSDYQGGLPQGFDVDKWGYVRDADGHIQYKDTTVDFTYYDIVNSSYTDTAGNKVFKVFGVKSDPNPYNVSETAAIDINDYNRVSPTSLPVTKQVVVPAGGEASPVEFTNEYSRKKGKLEVTKEIKGISNDELGRIAAADLRKITFKLYDQNGNLVGNKTYNYYDDIYTKDNKLTINDLPTGTYSLVETTTINSDYSFVSATYTVTVPESGPQSGSGTTAGNISIVDGGTTTVGFENTYSHQKGSLNIKKTILPDNIETNLTDDQKKATTFAIKDGSKFVWFNKTTGKYVGSYAEGQTPSDTNATRELTYYMMDKSTGFTITDLPAGNYSVQETGKTSLTGYSCTTTPAASGSNPPTVSVHVPTNGSASAAFTNTYALDTQITLKKHFQEDGAPWNPTGTDVTGTTFVIKNEDGTVVKTVTYANMGAGTSDKTYVIKGLEFPHTYTVTETSVPRTGYTLETTYNSTGGNPSHDANSASVKVDSNHLKDGVLEVTNNYVRERGKLELHKTFDPGDVLSDEDEAQVKFTIKSSAGSEGYVTYGDLVDAVANHNGNITVTLGDYHYDGTVTKYSDNSYGLLIEGLPLNRTYTITEGDADFTKFIRDTSIEVTGYNGGTEHPSGTISGDSVSSIEPVNTPENPRPEDRVHAVVTFTNSYTPTGFIKVDKLQDGLWPEYFINSLKPRLRFRIICEDGTVWKHTVNGVETDEWTLADLTTKNGVEVPAGKKYKVVEIGGYANVAGYDRTTEVWSCDSEEVLVDPITDDPSYIEYENTTEDSESRLDDVKKNLTTTYTFRNTYEHKGPGEGFIFEKDYQGLDADLEEAITYDGETSTYTPEGSETNTIHNRILVKVTRLKDENHAQEDWSTIVTLRSLILDGLHVGPGYYRIEELGFDTGRLPSAAAPDFYYIWNVVIHIGDELITSNPFEKEVTNTGFINVKYLNKYTPYGALKVTKNISGLEKSEIDSLVNGNAIKFTVQRLTPQGWITEGGILSDFPNYPYKDRYNIKDFKNSFYLKDMHDDGNGNFSYELTFLHTGEYRVIEEIITDLGTYTRTSTVTVGDETSASTTAKNITSKTFEIEKGGINGATVVAFDNVYTPDNGQIKVEKEFGGAYNNMSAEMKAALLDALTFTISDASGQNISWRKDGNQYIYDVRGSYHQMKASEFIGPDGKGSFTITDVPAGRDYTVTEHVESADPAVPGYTRTTKVKVGSGEETDGLAGTGRVTKNEITTFTFKNTYAIHGVLTIRKAFSPERFKDTDSGKAVTFRVFNLDGSPAKDINGATIQFTYDGMEWSTSENDAGKSVELAPNTYIVKESGYEQPSDPNYTFTTATVNGNTYDPAAGFEVEVGPYDGTSATEVVVRFKNNYDEVGKLTIKKIIAGNPPELTEDVRKAIVFIVTNSEGEVLKGNDGTYAELDDGGQGTFTYNDLRANGTYELADLPAGTYTITEHLNYYSEDLTDLTNIYFYGYTCSTNIDVTADTYTINAEERAATVDVTADGELVQYTNTFNKQKAIDVTKNGTPEPDGYATIDGVKYPYWEFTLDAKYLTSNTDIIDIFDWDSSSTPAGMKDRALWFRLASDEDGENLGPQITLTAGESTEDLVLTADRSTDGQATFHITGVKPAAENEDGSINVRIKYNLIVKDKDTMGMLNSDVENDDDPTSTTGVKWYFNNIAKYKKYPADEEYAYTPERQYIYDYTILDKDITNFVDQGQNVGILVDQVTGKVSIIAKFVVTLNPDALWIGDEELVYLHAFDTLSSNLTLRQETVECLTDGVTGFEHSLCDCTEGPKHTIHFRIPNGTAVQIYYEALLDTDTIPEGSYLAEIRNKFELEGFMDEVHPVISVEDYQEASIRLYEMDYLKVEDGNATNRLKGAKFALYDDIQGGNGVFKRFIYSNDDGIVEIYHLDEDDPSQTLPEDWPYHIVEVEPAPGYEMLPQSERSFYFIVGDHKTGTIQINGEPHRIIDGKVEYKEHLYTVYKRGANVDSIYNTPINTEVDLGAVKKLFMNDMEAGLLAGQFTFKLKNIDGAPGPDPDRDTVTVSIDADGKADFGTITYKYSDLIEVTGDDGKVSASNTFEYKVTEVIPENATNDAGEKYKDVDDAHKIGYWKLNGITYDGTEHTVKVTVTYNDSDPNNKKLDTAVTIDDVPATAENNVYWAQVDNTYDAVGEAHLTAMKSPSSTLGTRTFTFELYEVVDDTTNPVTLSEDPLQTTDPVTQGQTANFTALEYELADLELVNGVFQKTFKYAIKETIPEGATDNGDGTYTKDGVTYDGHIEYVNIQMSDLGNGTLKATYNGLPAFTTPSFTNVYEPTGNGEIKVKKVLDGREWTDDDEFTFTLTKVGNAPMPSTSRITIKKADADQTKSFGEITFTAPGTYNYKVKEVHGDISGIVYDETDHDVTIKVKDDGNGHLIADGTPLIQTVTITNTYGSSGKGQVKVQKVLEGRPWTDDDVFTFEISAVDGAPMPPSSTITIMNGDADHIKSFGEIKFTAVGTYKYKVKETRGNIAGVIYDTTEHEVTINVVDDGNGNLVAPQGDTLIKTQKITNTYESSGKGEVKVQKVLEGRDWTNDDVFEFTISAADGVPMPATTSITIKKEDADQTKSFGEITFTAPGTYTYKVNEVRGTIEGIVYETNEHTVTIKVVDDGNGHLVADNGSSLIQTTTFTNTYSASGEGEIKVQKVLEGRPWTDDDKFTFVLSAPAGTPMPPQLVIDIKKEDADQTKSFGKINFTEVGTYTYTVTEQRGTASGVTYDTSAHTVEITVVDDGNGHLVPDEGSSLIQTTKITNTYGSSGKGEVKVQKFLNGRAWTNNDQFTFTLRGVNGAPMPATTSITIRNTDADHIKSFGEIQFTEVGDYSYIVTETHGTAGGVTYDTSDHPVTIKIVDDGNGHLVAADDSSLIQIVEVTNTYAASGEGEVKVQKILDGREWTDDDIFTFTISAEAGVPMPAVTTIEITKADADQTKSFGKITYTKAGTYTYIVKETKGNIDGITYDELEHTVEITLVDNGQGELVAQDGDTLIKTTKITNTYGSTGKGEVKVQKVLDGRVWTDDDAFIFTISAAAGTPMPPLTQVVVTKDDADHVKSFGEITFTKVGTYTYNVKETRGGAGGVTYDETDHPVTIEVVDDGNGHLVAKEGDTLIKTTKVTNTYAATGKGEVKVKKVLNGRPWTNRDEYTFTISAADGVPMPATTSITIKNTDADHTKSFGEITYTQAGTYTYTVKETKGTAGGVTYDETEHTVTIEVVDDLKGNLVAAPDTDLIQVEEITNTYAASGKGEVKVQKILNGREWTDDDTFNFTIRGVDGAPEPATKSIDITKADQDQIKSFGEITYTQAGTYTYIVTETRGNIDGVTYDASEHTVTIKLVDNGEGELVAEDGDTLIKTEKITNTYGAYGEGEVLVTKELVGREWTNDDYFRFDITAEGDAPLPPLQQITITNADDNYTKSFGVIRFTAEGTYKYTVTEVRGSLTGVVYDVTPHEVTIETVDDGNGHIVAKDGTELIQAVTVTNTYSAGGTVNFNAKKILTNGTIAAGKFSFTLTEYEDETYETEKTDGASQTKTNDVSGNVTFDTISYELSDIGDHYYLIKEDLPVTPTQEDEDNGYLIHNGIKYTLEEFKIKVSVSDAGDGTLSVVKDPNPEVGMTDATFTNEQLGRVQITKKVTLNGYGTDTDMVDDTYSFTITKKDDPDFSRPPIEIEIVHGVASTAVVEDLPIGEYVITENLTADQKALGIELVSHNGVDVTASSQEALPDAAKAEFTNNRNIGDLKLTKLVQGTPDLTIEFPFTIELTAPTGVTFVADGYDAVKTLQDGTEEPSTVTAGADGKISVSLSLKTGETYEIKELPTGTTYEIVETQQQGYVSNREEDTAKGAVPVGPKTEDFVNTYGATGQVEFNALKIFLNGLDDEENMPEGKFEFTLTEYTDDNFDTAKEGFTVQKKANAANGTVTFDIINYVYADIGEHYYLIKEVIPADAVYKEGYYVFEGVRYDPTEYKYLVEVTDNNDGTLKAKKKLLEPANAGAGTEPGQTGETEPQEEEEPTGPDAEFTNEQLGRLLITKKVTVNGEATLTNMVDGSYHFTITGTDDTNNMISREADIVIKNGASSTAEVVDLPIGNYEVKEVLTDSQKALGITVDTENVTATASRDAELPEEAKPVFTNNRDTVNLKVTKTVEGTDDLTKEFKFTITLEAPEGIAFERAYPAEKVSRAGVAETMLVDAGGDIEQNLKAGETFEIKDLPSGTKYKVVETPVDGYVSDQENDTIEGTLIDDLLITADFVNTYSAEGEIELSGVKTWDEPIEGEEFEFTITEVADVNGTAITPAEGETVYTETVKNDADGNFKFTKIEYKMDKAAKKPVDDTGVHYYKVVEVKGDIDGTVYDETEYIITVTVTDNGDGTLKAEADKLPEEVKFYNAEPAILKAVNKDSHAELRGFNEIYTYDIVVYVPEDAEGLTITDQLVPGVQFKCSRDEVVVKDLGKFNPGEAKANGSYHAGNSGVFSDAMGTPINMNSASNSVVVDPALKLLTVTIGDTSKLKGHHVKVTFRAVIDNNVVYDLGTYEANKEAFADNGLLVSDIVGVPGVENGAVYTINTTNSHDYGVLPSNHVTVTPPVTKVTVTKKWTKDGEPLTWPADPDADGNMVEVPITFTLTQNGQATGYEVVLPKAAAAAGDVTGGEEPAEPAADEQLTADDGDTTGGDTTGGDTTGGDTTGGDTTGGDTTGGDTTGGDTTGGDAAPAADNSRYTHTFTGLPVYVDDNNVPYEYGLVEEGLPNGYTFELNPATGNPAGVSANDLIDQPALEYEASNTFDVDNQNNEEPSIEKYVNKEVHTDLVGFNKSFTYDIIAYVTEDAVKTVISDDLVPGLKFISSAADVVIQDIGTTEPDHTAGGTVSATVGKTPLDVAATETTVAIEGKSLAITIANSRSLRGHWLQVTFDAAIDDTVVNNLKTFEENKAAINSNGLVLSLLYAVPDANGVLHSGIPNEARYTIDANNSHKYESWSNTVTVEPPVTNVKVTKEWLKPDGTKLKWPVELNEKDEAEEIPITFNVLRDGKATEYSVVLPLTDAAADVDPYTYTFVGLPVYVDEANKDTPYVYTIDEPVIPDGYTTEGGDANIADDYDRADGLEYVFKVSNTDNEEPEIAKTVNKDVHAQLESYDEVFTYDVIAYITKDAQKAQISDVLVPGLKYISTADEVVLTDLGTTVDYTAGETGSFADGKGTALDTAATKTTVTIEGKSLAVAIDNAVSLRGHYVKATFRAAIDNDVVKDLGSYAANKQNVTDNGLVISQILTHEGVLNEASYTIEAHNGGTYEDESNPVTVTPKDTRIPVEKRWLDENEEEIEWPTGVEVVVTLLANGEATDYTLTLNSTTQSGAFEDLPIFLNPEVVYTVEETSVTGVPAQYQAEITGDAAEGYLITNKLDISGNLATPTGTKYYEGGTLTEGLFTFSVVEDKTGKVVSTGESGADGTITFKQIVYHQSDLGSLNLKTFNYTIIENMPEGADASNNYTVNGIQYDPAEKKFSVVLKRLDNGFLETELLYTDGAVSFTNKDLRGTKFKPAGKKYYKNGTLTDGGFAFRIRDAAGTTVSTGTSKADGTIDFTAITYKEADLGGAKEKTFEYTVSEVLPAGATAENKYTLNGITYDASEKKLSVKVSISDDGNMTAVQLTGADTVAFTNTKQPTNGGGGGNTPSGGGGGTTVSGGGAASVKTGDDTPIMMWILILIAAMAAAGGAVVVSRKRKKEQE